MTQRVFLFFCIFVCANLALAQKPLSQKKLNKQEKFFNLEKALQSPEKVYFLSLWSLELKEVKAEDLAKMSNIQHLELNHNELTSIPETIGQLKNLQKFTFQHNYITTLPQAFFELKYLEKVDAHKNKLTFIPKDIGNLINLKDLDLHNNQLTTLPEEIKNLKKLEVLNLSENPLSESEVARIRSLLPHTKVYFTPKPQELVWVQDKAKLLSQEEVKKLNDRLLNYEDSTSTEILIQTIETLDGANLEEYSFNLANTLGIGKAEKDNGILILVPKKERLVRIQLGLGISKYISDEQAKVIIDKQITPNFKQDKFYRGFDEALSEIFKRLEGKFEADH